MNVPLSVVEPNQIGPYKFHGTVGDGAFSVVKLVKNINTGDFFACKIVPRSRINTKNLEERFEAEIRISQQMHHSGIVELYDLLKDNFNFYVIMEFCPNGELFQFIVDQGGIPEEEAKPFLREILEALNYVHQKGISHRDLKPENLLLDADGHIKLSDFGLSRYISKDGLVDTPCGSPCYASPECLSGQRYDGITTDVWSIGVIFYAMLTGQLPWTKRNQTQLFKQIRSGDYKVPKGLSEEATDLIKRMMDINYKTRITIPEIFEHPFLSGIVSSIEKKLPSYHVSLRKVDQFFNTDGDLMSIVSASDAGLTSSQRAIKVGKLSKQIRVKPSKLRSKPSQNPKRVIRQDKSRISTVHLVQPTGKVSRVTVSRQGKRLINVF